MDVILKHAESSISTVDHNRLVKLLSLVNRKFFRDRINAEIRWEVPKGSVTTSPAIKGLILSPGSEEHRQFEQAKQLLGQCRVSTACTLLEPLAEAKHLESQFLLMHIYRRIDGDWRKWAKRYNASQQRIQQVPAACYYPDTRVICIHPHLRERSAPQFVLRYLIYHECCHQIIPCNEQDPHNEDFMKLEYQAPNRERAINWLKKEGFPTLSI